jgi:hypothetical protein
VYLESDLINLEDGLIPVVIHVQSGIDSINQEVIQDVFNQIQEYFSNEDPSKNVFKFSIREIRTGISLTESLGGDDAWIKILKQLTKDSSTVKKLNIVYLDNLGGGVCGGTYGYGLDPQGIIMSSECLEDENIQYHAVTLGHEIGHFFGLKHTHDYFGDPIRSEYVSGIECIVRGDQICDTPVSPNLLYAVDSYECEFEPVATIFDLLGVEIQSTDVSNIMSYSPRKCMDHFTKDQKNKMYNVYLKRTQPPSNPATKKNRVKINVYPNPVKMGENIVVQIDMTSLEGSIFDEGDGLALTYLQKIFTPVIYDQAGKVVQSSNVEISGLGEGSDGIAWKIAVKSPGIYFVHLIPYKHSNYNKIESAKIIVTK